MDQPIIQKKTMLVFFITAIIITLGYFLANLLDKRTTFTLCRVGTQKHLLSARVENNVDLLITSSLPKDTTLLCLGRGIPYYDKEIEVLILTSVTDSTITELLAIGKRYSIKKVYIWTDYNDSLDILQSGNEFKNIASIEYLFPGNELTIEEDFSLEVKNEQTQSYLVINTPKQKFIYLTQFNEELVNIVRAEVTEINVTLVYVAAIIDREDLLNRILMSRTIKQIFGYVRLPYSSYKDFNQLINLNTVSKSQWRVIKW